MRMYPKIRKRRFLLMETLIAFLLATIILSIGSALIFSYIHIRDRAKSRFEEQMKLHMQQSRLRSILQNMQCPKSKIPLVFSAPGKNKNPTLLFRSNLKAFHIHELANTSFCYLFLEKEGLKLAIHTDLERKKINQSSETVYLIWPKATGVSWKFLGKENLSTQTLDWTDSWDDPKELPLAIRVTINEEKHQYTLTTIIEDKAIQRIPISMDMGYAQLQEYLPKEAEEEEE